MAWVVGVISVGPPSGVDPVGKMRLWVSNKQKKSMDLAFLRTVDSNNILLSALQWFQLPTTIAIKVNHYELLIEDIDSYMYEKGFLKRTRN